MGYFKNNFYGTGRKPSARGPIIIEVQGLDNLETILSQLPEQVAKKPMQQSMRKAAKPLLNAIKAGTPSASGETKSNARIIAGRGANIAVGFKGGKQYMPAYMKAYWSAYGTLENRDQEHWFKNKRKAKTRWRKGGIVPIRFVEKAWDQTGDKVRMEIERDVHGRLVGFLQKHAYTG